MCLRDRAMVTESSSSKKSKSSIWRMRSAVRCSVSSLDHSLNTRWASENTFSTVVDRLRCWARFSDSPS